MVSEKAKILIDASEKEYFKVTSLISDLYDKVFSDKDVKWSKTEVLSNMDAYVQSFLTVLAVKNGRLSEDETTLIATIVRYGTVYQDLDITLFADCNFEMRNKLNEIVSDTLSKTPFAVVLSSVIDKKYDRKITKEILNGLIKVGYNLCCMSNRYDSLDEVKATLKSITDFITANSIPIQ